MKLSCIRNNLNINHNILVLITILYSLPMRLCSDQHNIKFTAFYCTLTLPDIVFDTSLFSPPNRKPEVSIWFLADNYALDTKYFVEKLGNFSLFSLILIFDTIQTLHIVIFCADHPLTHLCFWNILDQTLIYTKT